MIDRGARGPLTLVSSPAGTGKTVALATWVASGRARGRVVWITFGEDCDTEQFWALLTDGLRRAELVPVETRRSPAKRRPDHMLAAIALAVAVSPTPITLVVDCAVDLPPDAARDLHNLVAGSAGQLHLITLTRADPLLPLHLYRMNESVVEIRMADLAFTPEEAQELLLRRGTALELKGVEAFVARTRGWAAALTMLAMSLAHARDPQTAVRQIGGRSGRVAEYLIAEVLGAQTPAVRQLLLRTSVVDHLRPGLAEALAGPGATRSLAFLTRGNAFVEEVPGAAQWYQYHPLFRELLVSQLTSEAPQEAARLHLIAAQWFADEGMIGDAVRAAVSADAWDHAAQTVVDNLDLAELLLPSRSGRLRELFDPLPATAGSRAAFLVRAALALGRREYPACARYLDAAGQRLDAPDDPSSAAACAASVLEAVCSARTSAVADRVLASAAAARALLGVQGRAAAYPELVILVEDAAAQALLSEGRFAEAADACAGATSVTAAGFAPEQVRCLGRLAFISAWSGSCRRAIQLARRSEAVRLEAGLPQGLSSPLADVALAWAYTDAGELGQAAEHLLAIDDAGDNSLPQADRSVVAVATTLVRARIARGQLDLPRARATLSRYQEAPDAGPRWATDQILVEQAAVDLLDGDPHRALEIPDRLSPPNGDAAMMVHAEAEILCNGAPLPPRVRRAKATGALSVKVQAWLLDAFYQARHGDEPRCEQALERALRLAAPEHLRRPFHEAPEPVRRALATRNDLIARHSWLLGESGSMRRPIRRTDLRGPVPNPMPQTETLAEPLTNKELEVLALLVQLCTTEETAAAMFISVNTVRTHVRNILRKLGVKRRNQAIRRARDLGIVPPLVPEPTANRNGVTPVHGGQPPADAPRAQPQPGS